MSVNLSPLAGAGWQFFDDNGSPLTGGKLYTYAAGTSTPQPTYTSSNGLTPNANPIILDAAGRTPSEVWLTNNVSYKFVLKSSTDVLIGTYDDIQGVNDTPGLDSFVADLANTANVAKGDALVGFRQSNASGNLAGSVGRTVHLKLQEWVSVMDFGASNDGTNATATQAAFVAALAASDSVYVPPGTYLVNGNINIQNKTLFGQDQRTTIIKLNGSNTNVPMFINGASDASSWGSGGGYTMYDLTLEGNWDGSTANPVGINFFDDLGSIVKWYAGAYVTMLRCKVHKSFAHGIGFRRLGYSQIQFCEITTNKYNGAHLSGISGSESVTSTAISNNSIHSCRGTALVYLQNAISVSVTQNVMEDATTAVYVDGNDNRAITITENYVEFLDNAAINIAGAGLTFCVMNNFLGVATPISVANPLTSRLGVFYNNTFQGDGYVTSMPTLGTGTEINNKFDFFGSASPGNAVGFVQWRSNNNNNAGAILGKIGTVHEGTVNQAGGALFFGTANPSTNTYSEKLWIAGDGTVYPDGNQTQLLGSTTKPWLATLSNKLMIVDGVTAPTTVPSFAQIYVDTADGDLKIKFGDGTVKTIVTD